MARFPRFLSPHQAMPDSVQQLEEKMFDEQVEAADKRQVAQTDLGRYGTDQAILDAHARILAWSPEERRKHERALVRKLDVLICVPIFIMYITNYLDRNSISQARITGLTTATHITGAEYSTVNGIFYISCPFASLGKVLGIDIPDILAQTPANLILAKARPSIFLPVVMILWAVISACTAATKSYGQLIAVRFILGFCEAPFYPGAVFYLSCWYTKKEIGKRISVLVSGICISNAFAGLISAGIINGLDGKKGLGGWQWIFIVEGSLTVFLALVMACIIPDYPHTTRYFNAQNKVLSQLRLDEDVGTADPHAVGVREGLILAVKDYRTWCFGALQWSITIMIGFNFFYPTLIEGLGFSNKTEILLLTAPPYILAFLVSFGLAWNADRTQKRVLHYEIATGITAIGLILLIGLAKHDQPGAKYFSTFILASGSFAAYACSYPWLSQMMPRPATKRATSIAIANSLSNVGAFLSSYVYISTLGPDYQVSWAITLGFTVFVACMVAFLGWRAVVRNKHLAKVEADYVAGTISEQQLDRMGVDEQLAAKSGFRLST